MSSAETYIYTYWNVLQLFAIGLLVGGFFGWAITLAWLDYRKDSRGGNGGEPTNPLDLPEPDPEFDAELKDFTKTR